MKKIIPFFAGFLILLLALLPLAGCQAEIHQPVEKPKVLNVSYSLRPLNVPSIVALEKRIFEEEFAKEGIEVKWHELEGPATTEALAAKSIDIATSLNYVSAIVSKANGNDLKVISSYTKFPKGIGLVVGSESGIASVADLKGKRVALQKGTMLHEMLIKALEQENIPAGEVEIVGMPSADGANAVMQKQVDGAVLPEPLLTKVLSSKKVRMLKNAEGLILGQAVIAARTDFLEKYPDTVKKFLQIHNQALSWAKDNQEEAFAITSKMIQMDPKAVNALYPKFDFSMEITKDNIEGLKKSADFLKSNKFLKEDVNTEKLIQNLIDTGYLPIDK